MRRRGAFSCVSIILLLCFIALQIVSLNAENKQNNKTPNNKNQLSSKKQKQQQVRTANIERTATNENPAEETNKIQNERDSVHPKPQKRRRRKNKNNAKLKLKAKRQKNRAAQALRERNIGARKAAFMVQLISDESKFICSGSILTEWHIVTAASCILNGDVPLRNQRIIANSSHVGEGDMLQIDRAYLHPLYKGVNSNKDVAVIKLKQALVFGEGIAKKATCKNPLENNETIDIYGWAVNDDMRADGHLQTISTKSMTHTTCSAKFHQVITQNMMCAKLDKRKNVYQRYSGGAVIYKRQICGIGTRTPGIYTDAAKVRGFLRRALKDDPTLTYLV